MKIKVSEATGVQLDWLVAVCEDKAWFLDKAYFGKDYRYAVFIDNKKLFSPSTNWAQAGAIIENHKIITDFDRNFDWDQPWRCALSIDPHNKFEGETPLIAAMRCYVASKFGDEAEMLETLA